MRKNGTNDADPLARPDNVWPPDRNIVLTGFMGTGKSTVGRVLADRLGYDFVDTDALIVSRHGPVASIFEARGEEGFRDLEHDVARELSERRRSVISTGGRLMLDDRNVAALAPACRICCLFASADEIARRVRAGSGRSHRPLLNVDNPRQRIAELLAERDAGYRRFLRVSTSRRSPKQIAADIVAAMVPPTQVVMSGTTTVFIGSGLMTTVSDLVGPVDQLVGDQAPRFASQLALNATDRPNGAVVAIGAADSWGTAQPTVWIPSDLADFADATTSQTVIFDAAVIQAMRPGFTPAPEILTEITAQIVL